MSGTTLSTKGVGFSGGELATKGLVDVDTEGAVTPTTIAPAPTLPPGLDVRTHVATRVQDATVIVVVPTAINVCLIAAENITGNLRARQVSDLDLPSLYKRAFLVAYETDEIALVRRPSSG